MFQIQEDWTQLENCPIDITEIELNVEEFYRLIGGANMSEREKDYSDMRKKLVYASFYLNTARIILRNCIGIENNEYIREHKEDYYWLIDNINRADKRIDEYKDAMIKQIENASVINIDVGRSSLITLYEKLLIEYMENFVYYPLKMAYKKFARFRNVEEKEKEGKKVKIVIKKNKELFLYFLFLELLHTAEMLGGIAREETKTTTPKGYGRATQTPSRMPPPLPKNVEKEEKEIIEDKNKPIIDFDFDEDEEEGREDEDEED